MVKTGEIWLAQLDPTVGREIQKTRPCVVISPQEMNEHLQTVIVAPMTTGSRPAGFRVPVGFQGKQGLIVLDQIRTLDRLGETELIGHQIETGHERGPDGGQTPGEATSRSTADEIEHIDP